MKRIGFVIVAVALWTYGQASAGIIVSVPDTDVPETTTVASLTVTATFQQNPAPYDMGGFNVKLDMAGDAGCVFAGASAGALYALGVGNNWDAGSIMNAGRTIEEITDARDNDAYLVDASAGDVVLDLVVIDVAFSGISIGDQFIIEFDAASTNDTALFEYSGNFHTPTWNGGTTTVVPEPASVALLVLCGLTLVCRKRN